MSQSFSLYDKNISSLFLKFVLFLFKNLFILESYLGKTKSTLSGSIKYKLLIKYFSADTNFFLNNRGRVLSYLQ